MGWLNGFFIPIIKVSVIGGILCWIVYIVGKAFHNAWSKSFKFFWKYKIRRKKYPEETINWIMDAIDQGMSWYDAKKFLLVKQVSQGKINETLWIYDRIIEQLSKEKGGINKHGREPKGNDREEEATTLPSTSKTTAQEN